MELEESREDLQMMLRRPKRCLWAWQLGNGFEHRSELVLQTKNKAKGATTTVGSWSGAAMYSNANYWAQDRLAVADKQILMSSSLIG